MHQAADDYLAIPDHRDGFGSAHGNDAGFGRVDDRSELFDTEHAEVRDRECGTGVFLRLKLLGAGLCRKVFDLGCDLYKAFEIGPSYDRRDQSVLDRDSYADIRLLVKPDRLVLVRGVREWML